MPRSIVKITIVYPDELDNFVTCEIGSRDSSWHGLKELERENLFKKLQAFIRSEIKNENRTVQFMHQFDHSLYFGGSLKPHSPKPTSLNIYINKDVTVEGLTKFFDDLGFDVVIAGKYPVSDITTNTTLGEYADKVEESWFAKIEREGKRNSEIKKQMEEWQDIPNIENYLRLYPDMMVQHEQKDDKTKEFKGTTQSIKMRGGDWQITFRGEDAVKQAIRDAINRSEELDERGNMQCCPITLQPFEGHNQVILILSRNSSDGTMQAGFVHAKMQDGRKSIDVAEYLKTLKKNPINNDPIVAIEVGTLSEIKDKYRLTRPLRPTL